MTGSISFLPPYLLEEKHLDVSGVEPSDALSFSPMAPWALVLTMESEDTSSNPTVCTLPLLSNILLKDEGTELTKIAKFLVSIRRFQLV